MTLIDAGPLIALIDKGQGEVHQRCIRAQELLTGPLLTSWPCFTEAMYFLGGLGGWPGQKSLWDFVDQNALFVHAPTAQETIRMKTLMELYQDVPMDLANWALLELDQ